MKKILYIALCVIVVTQTSCSTDEIKYFDSNNYVYFDESVASGVSYPSLSYTFAFQNSTVKETTYTIPVKFAGRFISKNATFTWNIVDSLTTAVAGKQYDLLDAGQQYIPANDSVGTAKIKLLRSSDMTNKSYSIVLQLVPNENFKIGPVDKVKITVTDQIVKPDWWTSSPYVRFLGTYSLTKLKLWFEFMGVTDGSNPFETSKYIMWLDYGTGIYNHKVYKDSEVRTTVAAFRTWLINTKGNPYDNDLKEPVAYSLGSY